MSNEQNDFEKNVKTYSKFGKNLNSALFNEIQEMSAKAIKEKNEEERKQKEEKKEREQHEFHERFICELESSVLGSYYKGEKSLLTGYKEIPELNETKQHFINYGFECKISKGIFGYKIHISWKGREDCIEKLEAKLIDLVVFEEVYSKICAELKSEEALLARRLRTGYGWLAYLDDWSAYTILPYLLMEKLRFTFKNEGFNAEYITYADIVCVHILEIKW